MSSTTTSIPSDEWLRTEIIKILSSVDLNEITENKLRKILEKDSGCRLETEKLKIKNMIREELQKRDENDQKNEAKSEENKKTQTKNKRKRTLHENEEIEQPKKKEKKKYS